MRTVAVIGKNFGDEGKGLAVDYLALRYGKALVVRHNGGAQSGHTVETRSSGGKRFVFHELSAGSLRGADTLWADTYHPDLFKLSDELDSFKAEFGFAPAIYAEENTGITLPDDVLVNMALEASRGGNRHGSCGMGINECDLRTGSGSGLTMRTLSRLSAHGLYLLLSDIRRSYFKQRIEAVSGELNEEAAEYLALLSDDNVIKNAAEQIARNMRYVNVLSANELEKKTAGVDALIFESGQGLLLSRDNKSHAPHLTASFTGLKNPCGFLARIGHPLDEVIYVSRTYVTRHGAGSLSGECSEEALGNIETDRTNRPNEWQGRVRYAPHESEAQFTAEVNKDLSRYAPKNTRVSLFLTHLNETDNCVVMHDQRVPVETFIRHPMIKDTFNAFYLSASRFSDEVAESQ